MVGSGHNRKSMAYVGNVSAFLVHTLGLGARAHLFNYVDKRDFSMQDLVDTGLQTLGRPALSGTRISYAAGYVGVRRGMRPSGRSHRQAPAHPRQQVLQHHHHVRSLRTACSPPASSPQPPSAKP